MNTELKYNVYPYNAKEAHLKRQLASRRLKRKRQQTLLRRKLFAALAIIIIAISSIIIITAITARGDEMKKEKCYKSIMVEYGDTLWDIAKEYYDSSSYTINEYIDELKAMNSLECDKIKSGSYIVVSYYR